MNPIREKAQSEQPYGILTPFILYIHEYAIIRAIDTGRVRQTLRKFSPNFKGRLLMCI